MQVIIYPPLAYEVNGELLGVAPEVVKQIQARVGDINPIRSAPWLRAYEQAVSSPGQALFAIVRIPEREKLFKWVGPIFSEGDYFFCRKGSDVRVADLEEAKRVTRIAVRKDGYTHQALAAAGFRNLDISPSYDSSYKKLEEGRVDLVLMGERTYAYMVSKAGLDPSLFERTQCKFAESSAWLAFSRDVPDTTIARWQQALDELKSSGEYDKIMEHNFSR
ncbi:transporter substrate-binding domain-containing protein [Pseudodesulfovibrio cashew]|uniref:Transporter substrate-binding domain-containing protein n=1 Tax=Pseudodesulfovibrio cashew TaxID=2678688 RepID=A0A6I6JDJ7_9BACT|nr:transporter substrate-binding domain-containing protein [Pseudodesulfovibrio cashew]QGY38693.1 transporter substrate-binding domain-containing protein [Pseudodesulfovibrio cashew]